MKGVDWNGWHLSYYTYYYFYYYYYYYWNLSYYDYYYFYYYYWHLSPGRWWWSRPTVSGREGSST